MSSRRLALAGALLALALLGLLSASSNPDPSLGKREATRAALADRETRTLVEGEGYTRIRVTAVDDHLTRVSFFDGPRIVAEAAIDGSGDLVARANYLRGYRYGTELANKAPVLVLLTALFLLATLTLPLRSIRNLDALALAAFVIPAGLLNERYLTLSVLSAYPLLGYLGWRCLRRALRAEEPAPSGTPLLTAQAPRVQTVALLAAGAAVLVALITLTSTNVIDVGFASLNGATLVSHGTLPYGHITDVVHGDTYPLLAYVLYLPGAWLLPVHDVFDNTDGALVVALAAVLAAAAAFARAEPGDTARKLAAVLAWLAFPPVLITASSGSNDIVFAALVAWALVLWRHAGRSTLAWVMAAWVKVVPVVLLPFWLARLRGRDGARRAWVAVAALTLGCVVWLVALDGASAVGKMLTGISYQFERRSLYSAWTLMGVDPLRGLFLAGLLALAVWAALLARRRQLDLRQLAGLAGGLLIVAQLAGNYWAVTYMAWTFPCVWFALLSGGAAASRTAAGRPR